MPRDTMTSIGQVRTVLLGARLDAELTALLVVTDSREALRRALVETYFAPELQVRLLEQGLVNVEAYRYGEELLAQAPSQVLKETPEQYRTAVRDQGFRRVIVSAYDHRCAFCGIRMLTVDGHTAVDAVHIVPWSVGHNDPSVVTAWRCAGCVTGRLTRGCWGCRPGTRCC